MTLSFPVCRDVEYKTSFFLDVRCASRLYKKAGNVLSYDCSFLQQRYFIRSQSSICWVLIIFNFFRKATTTATLYFLQTYPTNIPIYRVYRIAELCGCFRSFFCVPSWRMVKQGIQIYARAKPTKQKLTGVSMLIGKELFVIIFLSVGIYLVKSLENKCKYWVFPLWDETGSKVVILLY